ncbi:MAG TPA: lysophospholipid acyltransferase family protein [Terriglobales bacterium]|nr:lysophospholipid acyltransferase family protein [Terriglobales bacterium]
MTSLTEIIIEKAMGAIAAALAAGRLKTIASGVENIPSQGPALIVARHYHHLYDGLALFAALPRPFHIVVTMDWVQSKPTKFFMESLNRLARWPMVLRGDAITGKERTFFKPSDILRYQRIALKHSIELLVEGKILVVFPEGYPNVDPTYTPKTDLEQFLPFKPGFVNMVAAAEQRLGGTIPIIPAGLRYGPGKSCVGNLVFGNAVFAQSFAAKKELVAFLESEVRRLSSGPAFLAEP